MSKSELSRVSPLLRSKGRSECLQVDQEKRQKFTQIHKLNKHSINSERIILMEFQHGFNVHSVMSAVWVTLAGPLKYIFIIVQQLIT